MDENEELSRAKTGHSTTLKNIGVLLGLALCIALAKWIGGYSIFAGIVIVSIGPIIIFLNRDKCGEIIKTIFR